MGKKSSGDRRFRSRQKKFVTVDSEDEYKSEEDPNPNSRSYIFDEIDEFHNDHEKSLLDSERQYRAQRQFDDEEVYSLDLTDEDEEGEDEEESGIEDEEGDGENEFNETLNRFTAKQRKDEMESDLEEDDENDANKDSNWGNRKSLYYSTDFVDRDYQTLNESDAELAEAEEREAKALQKRLAEQLDDNDFGFEIFERTDTASFDSQTKIKIKKDLSSMTKEEQLEIVNRESPELLNLISDLKLKLIEVRDQYGPLLEMVKRNDIVKGPESIYISSSFSLLLNYCTNVCFYLMLKAKQQSLKFHPIIETLVQFRKLIKELEPISEHFAEEIKTLLQKNIEDNEIAFEEEIKISSSKSSKKSMPKSEHVSNKAVARAVMSKKVENKPTKRPAENLSITEDEKLALEMYDMMKTGHKEKRLREANSDHSDESNESENDQPDETNEEIGKRGITYQISKNKGLTPYRAKERRNPRVKYRMKYRKAKIRRKGQVREVRKELNKYSGEFSGIKASTVRSIKIK